MCSQPVLSTGSQAISLIPAGWFVRQGHLDHPHLQSRLEIGGAEVLFSFQAKCGLNLLPRYLANYGVRQASDFPCDFPRQPSGRAASRFSHHALPYRQIPENRQQLYKVVLQRAVQVQPLAAGGMAKGKPGGGEHEAAETEAGGEVVVVFGTAVVGVADDRMADVLQVAAQLVFAAGVRLEFEQAVAAVRVAFNFNRDFHRCQAAVAGAGFAQRVLFVLQPTVGGVFAQRDVDLAGRFRPAATRAR